MQNTAEPSSPPTRQKRKTLRVFALASFLNDLGSDIIYPVWPLYITTVLKANMAALGFLDGLGEALVSLSQAASGYLSDKWRRRKLFIWIGYLCGGISRLGYALAAAWPQLLPFKMLDRIGKIRSAPRDAMVADISADSDRGRNFGLLRMMDNMGAFFGILISIALINVIGFRALFALAALPSLVGVALIIFFIREKEDGGRKIFKGLVWKDLDRNLRLYMALNALFALGAFSYSFLLIFARRAGFKIGTVPVLYLLFTATAMVFSLPFGRLSDRVGRKFVLFLAFAFWGAACGGFMLARGRAVIVGMFVLYGLHKAALEPVQRTLVTEICPPQFKASALGAFQMIVGLCALPASLLAGVLWETMGGVVPFGVSLSLTGCAALLLLMVKEKH